jgi:hypothetical protein
MIRYEYEHAASDEQHSHPLAVTIHWETATIDREVHGEKHLLYRSVRFTTDDSYRGEGLPLRVLDEVWRKEPFDPPTSFSWHVDPSVEMLSCTEGVLHWVTDLSRRESLGVRTRPESEMMVPLGGMVGTPKKPPHPVARWVFLLTWLVLSAWVWGTFGWKAMLHAGPIRILALELAMMVVAGLVAAALEVFVKRMKALFQDLRR